MLGKSIAPLSALGNVSSPTLGLPMTEGGLNVGGDSEWTAAEVYMLWEDDEEFL